MDKEQLIDDLNRVADDINSEMYETALDDLTDIISEVELIQEPSNDRTAIDAEMLDLLKGFVGIADKWIPHWKQPNAFKIQIKAIKEFLNHADQS